jgi:hypothetical protein
VEHIMIDIETLGTRPYSAIVALGAVEFDPANKTVGNEFYRVIEMHTCVANGLSMDGDTVRFWMQQSDQARSIFNGTGIPLKAALTDFRAFCGQPQDWESIKVWGNGASFDNVLLRCAYDKVEITPPWRYFNDRCYRTVKNMHKGVEFVRLGTHHNALDDARSQAVHLMAMPIWGAL